MSTDNTTNHWSYKFVRHGMACFAVSLCFFVFIMIIGSELPDDKEDIFIELFRYNGVVVIVSMAVTIVGYINQPQDKKKQQLKSKEKKKDESL